MRKNLNPILAIDIHREVFRSFVKQGLGLDEILDQEDMKLVNSFLSFDRDYYSQVYDNEFIYLWAFQGKYTIDYFIERIKSLPDDIDEKTTYTLLGEKKDPETGRWVLSEELLALEKLVYAKHLSIYYILLGGGTWNTYGETSKIRLLTVLNQLRTRWLNLQEVTEPWDEKYINSKNYSV